MTSPPWLDRLHARAQQPPALPRQPLRDGATECGSIEIELAQRMAAAGLPLRLEADACVLIGVPNEALAALARWMHAQGLGSPWRNELLAVTDAAGAVHAVVERAAVRPLGITTFAVHLVGYTAGGSVWVQQRALDKATDPGHWDTLMGGQVSADETTAQTLARETWEEAGLRLEQLDHLATLGRVTVRRPVSDGYMVEHIEMFEARLSDGLVPLNQDGEVARFDCVSVPTLVERLAADAFTLEATLIHAHWLRRRALL